VEYFHSLNVEVLDGVTNKDSAIELIQKRGQNGYDIVLCTAVCASAICMVLERLASRPFTKVIAYGHISEAKEIKYEIDTFLPKPFRTLKILDTIAKFVVSQPSPAAMKATSNEPKALPQVTEKRYCILLVEDNPVNQMVAVRQLDKLGYRSVVAENGKLALELLDQSPYPLILMDLQVRYYLM
jgi:PleD family two-component response regulator